MKKTYIAWALLLCMALTACGEKSSLTNAEADKKFGWGLEETEEVTLPQESTGQKTEPTQAPTETPTQEVVQKPTSYVPLVTTPDPTVNVPAVTEPVQNPIPTGIGKTVNYPIPIANPDKDVYYKPGGNLLKDYGTIGYDTIVEEYKDSKGVLWGRLKTGGWTTIYQQILPDLNMWFSSGVGAWRTELKLKGNGAFSGQHSDSDMGDVGDGYPNGTVYICNFSGRFKVTDIETYAIHLEMTSLTQEEKENKTWIKNSTRYIGSDPYGLSGGKKFVLYTPSTPAYLVPEDARSWGSVPSSGSLGRYVLYCPALGTAFFE